MNQLFQGDNLEILHNMPSGSVDLIYADPPFNTRRTQDGTCMSFRKKLDVTYNDKSDYSRSVHRSGCQDWHERNKDSKFYFLHHFCSPSELYYFETMIPVLIEIKRVLKISGALYWQCNWRTSHIYRMIISQIFGDINCFKNEIIWHYPNKVPMPSLKKKFSSNYDNILFYTRVDKNQRTTHDLTLEREAGTKKKMGAVWSIPSTKGKERVGYPTQKPMELLMRMIKASSNQHDIVLDPFAGSGTTLDAAQSLGRHWIGIDVGDAAIKTIQERMRNRHGLEYDRDYEIIRGT